jgi:hypothetical protein
MLPGDLSSSVPTAVEAGFPWKTNGSGLTASLGTQSSACYRLSEPQFYAIPEPLAANGGITLLNRPDPSRFPALRATARAAVGR